MVLHLLVLHSTRRCSFSRMENGFIKTFYLDVHWINEFDRCLRVWTAFQVTLWYIKQKYKAKEKIVILLLKIKLNLYFHSSKYATLKLGNQDDEPEYNAFTWFMMLFACGVGVGLFFYGVAEPIYHYTSRNRYSADPTLPDNELAQIAINLPMYHWGKFFIMIFVSKTNHSKS